ncbi:MULTISPECIES: class I SAM-dependent methyltransferase [unclassified Streptomyces]|uniref:class I SAM-dependent methyltransferase n=1 Tax=unclassified Streptomyces TaxID=2593676 RepID=UPI002E30027E|nr:MULTISPECIES: class I SAM-dependent methyltransferase [unclassified Streptomyces]WUC63856.1 class I SAM-dependent methyltransferase [Streptomyces sp. NBC_00539]
MPGAGPAPLVDHAAEAVAHDAARGGAPRAGAAAAAVLGLLPPTAGTLLDVGCGTGVVTTRLTRPGLRVLGADASYARAATAARRGVPVVLAHATRLPFPAASLDAVSAVWLLHLLREPGAVAAVVAEAGRVLRPGGVFLTTVDKDAAHDVGSDIDEVFAPHLTDGPPDAAAQVTAHAAEAGLRPYGDAPFTGHGQGRTPRRAAADLLAGRYASHVSPRGVSARELADRLERLPGQDTPRQEPTYRLQGFVSGFGPG